MFDSVVLGVDPGTAAVGLAVVGSSNARPSVRWSATVRTPAGLSGADRLRRIHDAVRQAISEHRPQAMAIERLMWGRNTQSAMDVSRATGVVLLAAAQAGLAVEEYPPLQVKMAVTGVGNAPKEAVRRSLTRVFGIDGVPGPSEPDAIDAVAVAVCHLQHARMRRVTREAVR
jgi:crossover junction endodeoxyribonuclease RuvC